MAKDPVSDPKAEAEEESRRFMEKAEANKERILVFLKQAFCEMFPDRKYEFEEDLISLEDFKLSDYQKDKLLRGVEREFNLTSTPYVDFDLVSDLDDLADLISDYF